jgi:FixJ family two-component response regulator
VAASETVAAPRVLVAEDDASMRAAVERLLRAAGFAPVAYESAEALLADDARPPAGCLVSDLRLPGISGLELLAELRARGWQGAMVVITAYDAPGRRELALRSGGAAYLVKPFRGTELLRVITAVATPTGPS